MVGFKGSDALLARWDSFVRAISLRDKIAIIHDADPDGVSSAVILAHMIRLLRGRKVDIIIHRRRENYTITTAMMRTLRRHQINKIFTVDLALDEYPEVVSDLEQFAELVIIDHHTVYKNVTSMKTLLIKAQFISSQDPAAYASSKLTYDLALRVADVRAFDWVAAIGVIGDCGSLEWGPFLLDVCRRNKIRVQPNWFKTDIGRVANMIICSEAYGISQISKCVKILFRAQKPNDVLFSVLQRYVRPVEDEIKYYVNNVRKLAFFYEDLIFYDIKPKYHIKSALSTILGQLFLNRTVVIANTRGRIVSISARRNDCAIAMNTLLEQVVKGLPDASGGGHKQAAAARLRKENYECARQKIMTLLDYPPISKTCA